MVSDNTILLLAGGLAAAEATGVTNVIDGGGDDGGGGVNITIPPGIRGAAAPEGVRNSLAGLSQRLSGLETVVASQQSGGGTTIIRETTEVVRETAERAAGGGGSGTADTEPGSPAFDPALLGSLLFRQSSLEERFERERERAEERARDVRDVTDRQPDGDLVSRAREAGIRRERGFRLQDYATPKDKEFGVGDVIATGAETLHQGGQIWQEGERWSSEAGRWVNENRYLALGTAAAVGLTAATGGWGLPVALAATGGTAEIGSDIIRDYTQSSGGKSELTGAGRPSGTADRNRSDRSGGNREDRDTDRERSPGPDRTLSVRAQGVQRIGIEDRIARNSVVF